MATRILRRIGTWVDERLEVRALSRAFLDRNVPPLGSWTGWLYTLGSATLVVFALLVVTGIFLASNYSPSPDHAWDSVQFITNDIPMGSLVRAAHHWSANAMVVLVFLHGLRVFFMAAYKYPRELTWIVGVFLMLLVLSAALTGYLLPWDQRAYWGTTVSTDIVGSIPGVGPFLRKVLIGGDELGAATLTRFYTFHLAVIPLMLALLIGIHLFMVIRQGISTPPER
ncbi:cytochrome bc complex cytochrome b subunit [Chloroflexota bacterium]